MTNKTYSSKSNAVRALKTLHPELTQEGDVQHSNAYLAEKYVRGEGKAWTVVIPADVRVVKRHILKGVQFRRRSIEPEGVTSAVHDMFDEYEAEAEEQGKTLTRKQFIARAVRDGVAYYTARTQFQKWRNPK